MEEIIYLEPDEEITSVIDKIKQSKSHRLSLVVPREATLLQSVVNLRLLSREATNLGKEIVIVTSDKIGRNLAAKAGLTVYDSIKSQTPQFVPPPPPQFTEQEIIEINDNIPQKQEVQSRGVEVHHFQEQKNNWRKQKVNLPAKEIIHRPKVHKEIDWSKSKKIIWPLLAISLILILIGLFLVFPKVEVKLKIQAQSYEKNLELKVSGDEDSSIENKIFGGELIDLTSEKEESFPATGKKNLGGKASGTLTLYNYWDSNSQNLGLGTKFSSSEKTFIAKEAVTIPGTSIRGGNIVPGTVNVSIEAEEAGEEYNVKAGRFTIVGLPAEQQEKTYGQSSSDLTGGFSKEVQVVSQADYDQAKEKIIKELNQKLEKEFKDKTEAKDGLEAALQIDTSEEIASAKVEQEAQEFNLKIKQRLRQIVFEREGFDNFVLAILDKEIPSDQMISRGQDNIISPQIKEKNYQNNILSLEVAISAKISPKIDTDKVAENLLGKSQSAGKNYLDEVENISGYEIKYLPRWWPMKRIPNYQRNLKVSLDYLEPSAESSSPAPSPLASPLISPEATNE